MFSVGIEHSTRDAEGRPDFHDNGAEGWWASEQLVITHNYTARDNQTPRQLKSDPLGLSCPQARLWGLSSIFCKLLLKEEIMIASEGLGGEPHSCHLRIIFHIKILNAQSLPLIKFPYINFAINSDQNWFPARTCSSY